MLWHKRFGHVSLDKLKTKFSLPSNYNHVGVESCIICAQAKQSRLAFPHSISQTHAPFDLIHVDVWGPYKHENHDGYKYLCIIVDGFRIHTWIHLFSHKSYAFTLIQSFVTFSKTQFHTTIKCIRTDNAK